MKGNKSEKELKNKIKLKQTKKKSEKANYEMGENVC